jgi:hypothetical protein
VVTSLHREAVLRGGRTRLPDIPSGSVYLYLAALAPKLHGSRYTVDWVCCLLPPEPATIEQILASLVLWRTAHDIGLAL